MADEPQDRTRSLLARWHAGDEAARDTLLAQHVGWLREHVRKRLGARLRRKEESLDIVQEAALEFLNYGPRFVPHSEAQFRALLGRVVENVLRERNAWFARRRRDMHRECALPEGSAISLDPGIRSVTAPSQAASGNEQQQFLRLALELMEPTDREVIVRRQFGDETFATIGEQLGISDEAARKRFDRALPKLSKQVRLLMEGRVELAVGIDGHGDAAQPA